MTVTCDVAIIGAGIVGAACAACCAQAGLRVVVVEPGPVGGGSTGSCMGHIVLMHDSDPQFALTSFSRRLWQELAEELPADVEYNRCGTIWLATDHQQMDQLRSVHTYYLRHAVVAELLDERALAAAEPHLTRGLAGGLYVRDDAVIYPPAAARYLLQRACMHRAVVITPNHATTVAQDGTVTLADGGRLQAQIVVNAAGQWAGGLTGPLPLTKRKGHLVVTDRYPGILNHQLVELSYLQGVRDRCGTSVAFNVQPRRTGQILIGSSRQEGSDSAQVQIPVVAQILHRAVQFMPPLAGLKAIRCWAGHRPATPDHLPLIGPLNGGRIWLATGHEGLGVTTSLGTASIMAAMITGRSLGLDPTPYLPGRLTGSIHA